jgi:hypothetical protein
MKYLSKKAHVSSGPQAKPGSRPTSIPHERLRGTGKNPDEPYEGLNGGLVSYLNLGEWCGGLIETEATFREVTNNMKQIRTVHQAKNGSPSHAMKLSLDPNRGQGTSLEDVTRIFRPICPIKW